MSSYDNYNPEIPDSDNDTLSFSDSGLDSKKRKDVKTRVRNRSRKAGKNNDKEESAQNDGSSEDAARQKRIRKKPESNSVNPLVRIREFFTSQSFKSVIGIFLILTASYFVVAFISFLKDGFTDQSVIENTPVGSIPEVANAAGEGGARLSQFFINDCFGLGSLVIVIWLVMVGLKLLAGNNFVRFKTLNFTIKCIVALITVSLIIGLLTLGLESDVRWGGNHGYFINSWIVSFFGWIGAVLLCGFMIVVFVSICMRDVVKWFMKKKRIRDERKAKEAEIRAMEEARRKEVEEMERQEILDAVRADEHSEAAAGSGEDEKEISEDVEFTDDDSLTYPGDDDSFSYDHEQDDADTHEEKAEIPSEAHENDGESADAQPGDVIEVKLNHIGEAENLEEAHSSYDPHSEYPDYQFPPYALLRQGKTHVSINQEEINLNQEEIRSTLLDFGIPIKSISATVGPTVTLYEIIPENGVKISKIKVLSEDIAMRLNAIGVRIIAPIPLRGTVGIEVPNKNPQSVPMRTVITSKKYQENKQDLPLALGATISNEVYMADLAKMPHLLVAGATGQGKSVGLNVIILSLLYRRHPSELKFVMVDPKMVELSVYNSLRDHYLAQLPGETEPIITDMNKVVPTLNALVAEMEDRYMLLKDAGGVKDIKQYNEKFLSGKLSESLGHRFMPYIVLVVDEFADLMMTAGKEVEKPIIRLAQKARAIGIHLILATQRPSTDVITGLIKANFPSRIAFKVSSGIDSKTILNSTAAENLIGKGDMLISYGSDLERVQCAFADNQEVEDICSFISRQESGNGPYILPEPPVSNPGEETEAEYDIHGGGFGDRDPLFERVAQTVVQSGFGSTSSIQRRYSIGYNRAAKIMDQLEAVGIVGPATGGKRRDVLVDMAGLAAILEKNK